MAWPVTLLCDTVFISLDGVSGDVQVEGLFPHIVLRSVRRIILARAIQAPFNRINQTPGHSWLKGNAAELSRDRWLQPEIVPSSVHVTPHLARLFLASTSTMHACPDCCRWRRTWT